MLQSKSSTVPTHIELVMRGHAYHYFAHRCLMQQSSRLSIRKLVLLCIDCTSEVSVHCIYPEGISWCNSPQPSCAYLSCRLFSELIENIHHWDAAEDEEALVNLLASYSQERFLVRNLTEALIDALDTAIDMHRLLCLVSMPCHATFCDVLSPWRHCWSLLPQFPRRFAIPALRAMPYALLAMGPWYGPGLHLRPFSDLTLNAFADCPTAPAAMPHPHSPGGGAGQQLYAPCCGAHVVLLQSQSTGASRPAGSLLQ